MLDLALEIPVLRVSSLISNLCVKLPILPKAPVTALFNEVKAEVKPFNPPSPPEVDVK